MTLVDLIRKRAAGNLANANPAKVANDEPAARAPLARLATLALANPRDGAATVAVANPVEAEVPALAAEDERTVLAWLAHIHETDPAAIADVLERCQRDPRARAYVLERASEIPAPAPPRMVCCGACKHFERTSYHPNLGHCAQSQPEPPAGLCDTDLRWCGRWVGKLN